MVAEVFSAMIQGIEGQIVKIQVDISNGLPNFNMIGYLSNEVKESKERVRTALNNIGVLLPPKRISVNFAPADFRKCGTSFDIGVAAAILLAMDFVPETYIKDTLFVGELSLNGQICPISGVLPIVVAASKRGIKRCIDDLEIFENVAYIMAYHADNSIPASIDEWLDQFDMFSIYEVLPQILELWGDNLATEVAAKKGLAEVNGK